MITSVAATVLLVTVKVAAVVVPAALNMVIAPDVLFSVTPVVRLVNCVTAPPAPVAYPTPAVPDEVTAPVAAKLVPVAAPSTGVTITMLVDVQLLMLPLVTVPRVGPDKAGVLNTMPVLVQALMLPLATVPRIGPVIVGLVNNWVFVSLFVVPPCTIGIMSEDAAADAAGKLEMATVVIIKSSQRKCCSVDDWQLCRRASPSHRQGC